MPVPRIKVLIQEREKIFGNFLKDLYRSWGSMIYIVDKAGEMPEIICPQDIDWPKTTEVDLSKFGEYTLNPDTIGINWETIPKEKIKSLDFKQFVGKPRWQLAQYITTQWPDRNKYHIPGIEYWKYVFEHPDQASASLKDGNYHYLFGSIFRDTSGCWSVPSVIRVGALFRRRGRWLVSQCSANERVVLLEK